MRIKIASRKSDLARIQAYSVGDALKNKNPNLDVHHEFRESLGDKNLNDPLWRMPEKGVFTEDFTEDLILGRADMIVHSWKDLPVEEREETTVAATLPRADMRDVLLFRKDLFENAKKEGRIKIFSSSPRRAFNLEPFFKVAMPFLVKEVQFEPVRGNVPTRVKKLFQNEIHGLIVAKAALDRLLSAESEELKGMQTELRREIEKCLMMILPLQENPTAAAQGALAIEIKKGREDLEFLLKSIHCEKTYNAVQEERERLKYFGGGCHQKVGASVRSFSFGKVVVIKAFTDKTGAVDLYEYEPALKHPPTTPEKIFPVEPADFNFFGREYFDVSLPAGPLYIAKADALPKNSVVSQTEIVWVSGFETWKKLASRGVWVTGCSESLGEVSDEGLDDLFGPLIFTKLSHTEAPKAEKNLATYKLLPRKNIPDLSKKTHFYWMSASQFKLALERYPEIKNGYHACGPGHSYQMISNLLKGLQNAKPVVVFPSLKLWKEGVLK